MKISAKYVGTWNTPLIRWLPILVLAAIVPFAYNYSAGHWCLDGHDAHGQLGREYQKTNDLILLALLVAFPLTLLRFPPRSKILLLAYGAFILAMPTGPSALLLLIIVGWLYFQPAHPPSKDN